MKDDLGNRMKEFYENRTRIFLPRRTNTIIRVDGKAFHTFTRGMVRPFDDDFIGDMNNTAIYLCENIQGAKLAYVQSDEISIFMTDYDKLTTDAWFDGNIQKIVSVSSSFATKAFNLSRLERYIAKSDLNILNPKLYAEFDSRTFTIPDIKEVQNYFIWRQNDAVRNSISSCAQSLYSAKELKNKNTSQMQDMCFEKGLNWNDLSPSKKRGRIIMKHPIDIGNNVIRNKWLVSSAPEFTKEKDFISNLIKNINQ